MAGSKKQQRTTDKPQEPKYTAPALGKGLDILELLSQEPDGLNLREIARRLDRSVSEIFRMIIVLEYRGYLSTTADSDRYTLSLKMFELSHRFPPVKRLTMVAGPVLKRLSWATEQSCHLAIYYEGKGHVVVQQDSPSQRALTVKLGAEAPLIDTCSGHVLLAYASETEISSMLEQIPSHHAQPKAGQVNNIIKKVRSRGYESIKSGQIQGVQDIGLPIFDHTGDVVAALVVPYIAYVDGSHQMEFSTVSQLARVSAEEISSLLGVEALQ